MLATKPETLVFVLRFQVKLDCLEDGWKKGRNECVYRCITGLMNVKMYISSKNSNMGDGGRWMNMVEDGGRWMNMDEYGGIWMNMVESGVLLIRTVKAFAEGLQECPRFFSQFF